MRRLCLLAAALALTAPALAQNGAQLARQDYPSNYFDFGHSLPPSNSGLVRGRAELEAGRYDVAAKLLEPLVDGTTNPNALLLAGYANLGAGRTGRAELYFERAFQWDHGNPYARHGLGLVALLQGDRDRASAQLEQLERSGERCGGQCSRADQLDRAAQSLRRAIG